MRADRYRDNRRIGPRHCVNPPVRAEDHMAWPTVSVKRARPAGREVFTAIKFACEGARPRRLRLPGWAIRPKIGVTGRRDMNAANSQKNESSHYQRFLRTQGEWTLWSHST